MNVVSRILIVFSLLAPRVHAQDADDQAQRLFDEAVRAMEGLIARFPKSEFVKDANLQIPRIWEAAGDRERSAAAYTRFAGRYPADSNAGDATLKAADLYAASGQAPRADSLRLDYVKRHPSDVETVMERILDEISFSATDRAGETIRIDAAYVEAHVGDLARNADLSRFIL